MELPPSTVPVSAQHTGETSAGPELRQDTGAKINWHNIEPILKWAAVAYGLGFLTVMWHTHRLGVPVLQLIEPVNIWIGAPLAIVVFFLDKLAKAANTVTIDFVQRVREIRQVSRESPEKLSIEWASDILARSLTQLVAPIAVFGLGPAITITKALVSLYNESKSKTKESDSIADSTLDDNDKPRKNRSGLLVWAGRIIAFANFVSVTSRFVNSIATICLVPLACFLYIAAIFPRIPQTLGGGRPVSVNLILPEESVPRGKEFEDWPSPTESAPQGSGASASVAVKHNIMIPVTLYFRTENECYVRKGSGPIIAFSDHAIEAIVFQKK